MFKHILMLVQSPQQLCGGKCRPVTKALGRQLLAEQRWGPWPSLGAGQELTVVAEPRPVGVCKSVRQGVAAAGVRLVSLFPMKGCQRSVEEREGRLQKSPCQSFPGPALGPQSGLSPGAAEKQFTWGTGS